ncbi:hypothetical protein D1007_38792 [Hordeum vulgare]|nr:hypothetical protein D1007_38792 [Hordeum vulgare]
MDLRGDSMPDPAACSCILPFPAFGSAALCSGLCPPPPRPRLRSLVVAPEGWAAQSSSGAPPRPRMQSIIVVSCEDSTPHSTPRVNAQHFNTDEARVDPALEWNLVLFRKEMRAMKASSSGDLHLQRRAPRSDLVALQQHPVASDAFQSAIALLPAEIPSVASDANKQATSRAPALTASLLSHHLLPAGISNLLTHRK